MQIIPFSIKRVSADYKFTEYLALFVLCGYSSLCLLNRLPYCPILTGLTNVNFPKYKADYEKAKETTVISYFNHLLQIRRCSGFFSEGIARVILAGKCCKNPEILKLNQGLDRKDSKADIYVVLNNGETVGISIKSTSKDPKTNFSVDSVLSRFVLYGNGCGGHIVLSKQENIQILKEVRHNILKKAGLHLTAEEQKKMRENRPELVKYRKAVNALFYVPNMLFNKYRELFEENEREIIKILIGYIYSLDVPYPMMEIDDQGIKHLQQNGNNIQYDLCSFREHEPYYLTKTGNRRNCAKMFYQLIVNGQHMETEKYRVEIRWKGDIQNASPQFIAYNDF